MGYTTDFDGRFKLDKKLDADTFTLLKGLAETRRMKRNIDGYGVEGEFYIDGKGEFGQGHDETVVDYNTPPRTQPSLWLQWTPTRDKQGLKWDGNEKFYHYVEWLEYLIANVLKPRGYTVSGAVKWRGEDFNDIGTITVIDNKVQVKKD